MRLRTAALLAVLPLLLGWRWRRHASRSAELKPGVFVMPRDGHRPVVAAIDGARRSVVMTMYRLTDPRVVDALKAARRRGAEVRVILDAQSLAGREEAWAARRLRDAGVLVRPSSPGFSITHEKALVVDGTRVLVMSANMTRGASRTRDYGVVVDDPGLAAEVAVVFEADWSNAMTQAADTPPLSRPELLWSPVDSETGLVALIASAKKELAVETENLGDPAVEDALAKAAARGVRVRVVVPTCDLNPDPLRNYPELKRLAAGGAAVRTAPYPTGPRQPYVHAKALVVDGTRAYVGSANLSLNSLTRARELGIVVSEPAWAGEVLRTFEEDWARSGPPLDPPPSFCPLPGD
ncbi:MAG: hypothetical protein KGL53_09780 [Elusimicrobia bacterium]|nr:hypothetical protein [Elusimicrobiota bacterium]